MVHIGDRGPVPNHSDDLARDPSRKGGDRGNITVGERRGVVIPEPDENWHPIALMLWNSLAESGQSDFYQQSDWAYAWNVCEEVSVYKLPKTDRLGNQYHKRSGQMFVAIDSALSKLLVTEGDRRRVRIELNAPDDGEDAAEEAVMNDYQTGLGLTVIQGGKTD